MSKTLTVTDVYGKIVTAKVHTNPSGSTVLVPEDNDIHADVFISPEARLGHFNTLHHSCKLHGNCRIYDNTDIGPFVSLSSATLEDDVELGPGSSFDDGAIIRKNTAIEGSAYMGKSLTVGENCHIGAEARFMGSNITIGDNCQIGEGVFISSGYKAPDGTIIGDWLNIPKD